MSIVQVLFEFTLMYIRSLISGIHCIMPMVRRVSRLTRPLEMVYVEQLGRYHLA